MIHNFKDQGWRDALSPEFEKAYFKDLMKFLQQECREYTVYPSRDKWFAAFDMTPFDNVKILILGQDPYHGEGQAQGIAFSVPEGVKTPPSLRNIYKEIADSDGNSGGTSEDNSGGTSEDNSGGASEDNSDSGDMGGLDLRKWAAQGVLLLNRVLTVRAANAGSHRSKGWEDFTSAAITALVKRKKPLAIMLWGKPAQQTESLFTDPETLILKAPHPSPLSAYRGFFGCDHFKLANEYLISKGEEPVDWL